MKMSLWSVEKSLFLLILDTLYRVVYSDGWVCAGFIACVIPLLTDRISVKLSSLDAARVDVCGPSRHMGIRGELK